MALPSNLDHDKVAEAALAILSLTAFNDHGDERAWKGIDWDLMNLLHEKGWIHNPVGKAKSVVLTEVGARLGSQFLDRHFSKDR